MLALWALPAIAADTVWIDVPLQAPEELPLFTSAQVTTLRGAYKGDDCLAAADDGIQQGQALGKVIRVVLSPDELAAASKLACRQRLAGDEVSASLVPMHLLIVSSESASAAFPMVPTERLVQITALLRAMRSDGRVTPIAAHAGKAWVHPQLVSDQDPVDTVRYSAEDRARQVFQQVAKAWVSQWSSSLQGLPELNGAMVEVQVPTRDPRRRGRRGLSSERFRFLVPTALAIQYEAGAVLAEELVAVIRTEHAPDPEQLGFQTLNLGAAAGSTGTTAPARVLPRVDSSIPEE